MDIYTLMWERMSKQDKEEAVHNLMIALECASDNFTSVLIRLAMKADSSNTEKLMSVYPNEIIAVKMWQSGRINQDYTF